MNDVVRFESVGLRYGLGPEVLQDVSFSLDSGSFHFLVGASGAGKSSLLRLMYLAQRPSRGYISLFGRDISTTPRHELPNLRRKIGVVFQDFRLLPHLSTFDNVALPLRVVNARESEVKRHVEELLAWVGLKDHMKARPSTLSGGQQQRVGIARALITNPSFLVLDEPTASLDMTIRASVLGTLQKLRESRGLTYLLISHDITTVEAMCTHVAVMHKGRFVEQGLLNDVINNPQDAYTQRLMSARLTVDEGAGVARRELASLMLSGGAR